MYILLRVDPMHVPTWHYIPCERCPCHHAYNHDDDDDDHHQPSCLWPTSTWHPLILFGQRCGVDQPQNTNTHQKNGFYCMTIYDQIRFCSSRGRSF